MSTRTGSTIGGLMTPVRHQRPDDPAIRRPLRLCAQIFFLNAHALEPGRALTPSTQISASPQPRSTTSSLPSAHVLRVQTAAWGVMTPPRFSVSRTQPTIGSAPSTTGGSTAFFKTIQNPRPVVAGCAPPAKKVPKPSTVKAQGFRPHRHLAPIPDQRPQTGPTTVQRPQLVTAVPAPRH